MKVRCLVVDYAQNMELPWFGESQPGEVYYYTPLNIFLLGVVNVVNDHLHAHLYHEGEGKKGGNNVSSLIMKTLIHLRWIEDEKTPACDGSQELNIVFDNCPGGLLNF